jgi:hypothetical protein
VRPYTGKKGERLYQSMKKTPIEMGRSEVHANTAKVCNLRSRGTTNGTNLVPRGGQSLLHTAQKLMHGSGVRD